METSKTTGEYSNPQLEFSLEQKHNEIISEVTLQSEHFAKQRRPALFGDTLDYYISPYTSQYDQMTALVRQTVQAENVAIDAQMASDAADEKTKEQAEKRDQAQSRWISVETEMKKKGIDLEEIKSLQPGKQDYRLLIAAVIIGLGEVFFGMYSFQIMGGSLVSSFFVALSLAIAQFMIAKYFAESLRDESVGQKKKALLWAFVLVITCAISFLMAKLRSAHLSEESGTQVSPFLLLCINLLFFAAAAWHFYRNTQTAAEKKRYRELLKYKNLWEGAKAEEEAAKENISRITQERDQKIQILMHKPAYQKWLIERIYKWREEAIGTFQSVNLAQRADRQTPDCFLKNLNQIQFNY